MRPGDVSLEVAFSHLEFAHFKRKLYAYRIKGIDTDWNYISAPQFRVNALAYGSFQLELKAQQSNGTWTESHTYPLIVVRPFYFSWWFISLSVLSIVGLVYLYFRYRFIKLKKEQEYLESLVEARTAKIADQKETLQLQSDALQKQAVELKRLDAAKSQFFANISHELRTPLTLIMGPINDFLKEGNLNHKDSRQMSRMFRNAQSLSNLVEEILELSKLEAGKLEIHKTPVKAAPFLRRVFAGFESLSDSKGIKFSLHCNFHNDVALSLDTNKLEKVINNLLSNALKFTQPGGEVDMTARLTQDQFFITVSDTGIGIQEKDLPHLFNRFYQVQVKNMALVQGGTGIGLALVKELMHAMDGEVAVESEPGSGTQFTLTLPKTEAQVEEAWDDPDTEALIEEITEQLKGEALTSPKSHRILLVEDHRDMQHYVHNLLSEAYKVDLAGNGLMALEALGAKQHDLVITDVMMPEMDGFTLLRRIKSNPLFAQLPVIMLTARAESEDKLNALTIGVDDYLTKPFLKEELMARVQNLLKHAKARRETANNGSAEPLDTTIEVAPKTISKVDLEWIKRMEREVQSRAAAIDFSLDSLASALGTSVRSLQRKLKEVTGLTPQQYIREVRLQMARAILEKKAYRSVSEVSSAVGFQSAKHFTKIFRERFGKGPKEYL